MKKEYLSPEMSIMELENEDVITGSNGFGEDTELPDDTEILDDGGWLFG